MGLVVTGVMMSLNPGVSVERRRPSSATKSLLSIYTDLYAEVEREFGGPERLTPESLPEVERFSRDWLSAHATSENAITGRTVREEASPGNFLLRRTDSRLDFLIHDVTGCGEPYPIVGAD